MNKKLSYAVLLVFFLSIVSSYAALDVKVSRIDDSIYLDESARFALTVINNGEEYKIVQAYTPSVEWHVELDPFISRIDGGTTLTTELKLVPSLWATTGTQTVSVYVVSPASKESFELGLPVSVKSFDDVKMEYVPSLQLDVDFPEEVDPREKQVLEIYIRNRNRLMIEEVFLDIESDQFTKYMSFPIDPLSERREKITFEIDRYLEPGNENIEVKLRLGNKTINREKINYIVKSFSTFIPEVDSSGELFKNIDEYVIKNDGNINKDDVFRVETSFLRRFFVSSTPKYDRIINEDNSYLEWDLSINSDDETSIVVVENYRPLIYIILIIVVAALIYVIYRSPVIIKKEAVVVGSTRDGISELKILIHVRNRSSEIIENTRLTDMIPSIASLVPEKRLGTLAPSKVLRHQRRGTIVKWEIDALEPFEERIVSYRLKSKVAIVGGFSLPPAKVRFHSQKGIERAYTSNKTEVSFGL